MNKFAIIVATNNDEILEKNLLSSKVIRDKNCPLILQRGYRNIGRAYNEAMGKTSAQILVCLHQDVFLPDGWETRLLTALDKLEKSKWGVLGVAGIKLAEGRKVLVGHIRDRGTEFGSSEGLPARVDTLDELLLVIRNDRNLLFDEQIPTTHMYGADICLQASSQGLGSFAIDAYCHHNASDVNRDTPEFRMAVKYMQKKWKRRLPFVTTCTLVESKTVENIRRVVKGLRLQPLAQPFAAGLKRVRNLRQLRKES